MYNKGDANLLQYIFDWNPTKTTKILPSCSYLKAENIWGEISATIILLVWTDIDFLVENQTLCADGALIYGVLQIRGLLYTQYGLITRYFWPLWMGRPQYLDQNNQSI